VRPAVDVVVPFRGSDEQRNRLCGELQQLDLHPGDTVVIVDNTPGPGQAAPVGPVRVARAAERQSPGYARNQGAGLGEAEWIVFFDADVEPCKGVLGQLFDPPPSVGTGLLAGGVRDEPVGPDAPWAARYAYIRAAMSQDDTFRFGDWGFPKTANVAIRRAAFESLGGFRDDLRLAEDADLTYRLRAAGWGIERREDAAVVHRSRQGLLSFIHQKAVHGSGCAWLARHYPGAFPARGRVGLTWWALRTAAGGVLDAARHRDRDRAIWAVYEPIEALAFEFGRSVPNERPLPRRWRAFERL